jgi:hypothetical protein
MTTQDRARLAIFIDYENVPSLDGSTVPDDAVLYLLRGARQKAIDDASLTAISRLGPDRLRPVTIAGEGKNALDFHIAFYLGEELAREPFARCLIVSGDRGFDPLIQHLRKRGFDVSRCDDLAKAVAAAASGRAHASRPAKPKPQPTFLEVADLLAKWPAKNRPRTRAGLARILETHYKGSGLDSAAAEALVCELVTNGIVAETDAKLSFTT